MTELTSQSKDGWTLDTLKALMDERDRRYSETFEARRLSIESELRSLDKAVGVAEANSEKWRNSANEWRQAMNDKDRTFITKGTLWGYAVALVTLFLTILGMVLMVWTRTKP